MHSEHLSLARDQFASIDDEACSLGPDGSVARSTIDRLVDAGLYGLMVPAAVGGQELPLADLVDVYAEISRADASTGWVHFACDLTAAYFGAYLPDDGVEDVFGAGVPLMAGQFAPNGTAVPADGDDDAWVLNGSYQFGSGITIADWAGGGMLATPRGADAPEYLFGCFPTGSVELRGNWDVLGLRATASVDYVVRRAARPGVAHLRLLRPDGATRWADVPPRRAPARRGGSRRLGARRHAADARRAALARLDRAPGRVVVARRRATTS